MYKETSDSGNSDARSIVCFRNASGCGLLYPKRVFGFLDERDILKYVN